MFNSAVRTQRVHVVFAGNLAPHHPEETPPQGKFLPTSPYQRQLRTQSHRIDALHETARAHMQAGSFAMATQARALADDLALTVHNPPAYHRLDLHGMTVMAAVSHVRAQLHALQQLAQVGSLCRTVMPKSLHPPSLVHCLQGVGAACDSAWDACMPPCLVPQAGSLAAC